MGFPPHLQDLPLPSWKRLRHPGHDRAHVGKVYVVAASNKIGGVVSNFKTVSLDQVDALVTDGKGAEIVQQMEIPESLEIIVATNTRSAV